MQSSIGVFLAAHPVISGLTSALTCFAIGYIGARRGRSNAVLACWWGLPGIFWAVLMECRALKLGGNWIFLIEAVVLISSATLFAFLISNQKLNATSQEETVSTSTLGAVLGGGVGLLAGFAFGAIILGTRSFVEVGGVGAMVGVALGATIGHLRYTR